MVDWEMSQQRTAALNAEDWLGTAIAACAEGGVNAIAVEPLAKRLGVTKGSFYWHFKSRAALLEAVLRTWEEACTEAIITSAERVTEPRERLLQLFDDALAQTPPPGATNWAALYSPAFEQALSDAADDPIVEPFVRRVAERRVDYAEACFSALGFTPDEAKGRALLVYAVYSGTLRLAREVPSRMPHAEAYDRYLEHLKRTLIP